VSFGFDLDSEVSIDFTKTIDKATYGMFVVQPGFAFVFVLVGLNA
jgi:hypothetical protein